MPRRRDAKSKSACPGAGRSFVTRRRAMSSEDVERGDGDDGFERFERLGRGLGASRARKTARTRETEATEGD